MYDLRSKSGDMKLEISARVASEIVLQAPGFWRAYKTKTYHTRAYQFTDTYILEKFHGDSLAMRIWVCEGDVLVDYDNRTVLPQQPQLVAG